MIVDKWRLCKGLNHFLVFRDVVSIGGWSIESFAQHAFDVNVALALMFGPIALLRPLTWAGFMLMGVTADNECSDQDKRINLL